MSNSPTPDPNTPYLNATYPDATYPDATGLNPSDHYLTIEDEVARAPGYRPRLSQLSHPIMSDDISAHPLYESWMRGVILPRLEARDTLAAQAAATS